ncbi:MAG TPA: molybdopterin cofactor-binding domain-containing protein, partial [Ktedonobacterales bacterium]|nr:molybdopterin cofactor-binding domain-containing protein [Ktedonobacterales bacterium]
AEQLEASVDDLIWEGETIAVRGSPGRAIPYATVVAQSGEAFSEEMSFVAPPTLGFAAQGVVVEVDPETLHLDILDYVICHDGGVVVNPLLADGQTIGAAVQGLGATLTEAMLFDEQGRPLTTTLQTYLLPSSAETPEYRLFEQHFPTGVNPEGFKGLAEGGTIPVMAALAQAIEDALEPFGVRLHAIPLTPDALFSALTEKTTLPPALHDRLVNRDEKEQIP